MSAKTSAIKKWYYDLSIRKKLQLSNILIILLPMILLSFLANKVSTDIMVKRSVDDTVQGLQMARKSIVSLLDQVEYLSELTVNNYNIVDKIYSLQKVLQQSSSNAYLTIENARNVNRSLSGIVGNGKIIKSILVYSQYDVVYSSDQVDPSKLQDTRNALAGFLDMVKDKNGRVVWTKTQPLRFYLGRESADCISMFRALIDGASGKVYGTIEIDMEQEVITRTFSPLSESQATHDTFIVDNEGTIISTARSGGLYESIRDENYYPWIAGHHGEGKIFDVQGRKYLVTSVGLDDDLGWSIVSLTPLDTLTAGNIKVTTLIFLIGLFCMLFAVILSIINSRAIVKPILGLSSDMDIAGNGDMTIRTAVPGNDEIGHLSRNFNNLMERLSGLMNRIYEEQNKKRRYELQALQSQINPHFLYNSLESVCSLAEMKRYGEVVEMVEALSMFYRTTLSSGRNVITIREEFDNVTHYLMIQKARYRDKFEYQIHFNEDLGDMLIVKLTLQPLVENAIYHGIRQKQGKGHIRLDMEASGELIRISVTDDGIGFGSEMFCRILAESDEEKDRKSFGLKNVNERIQLYFGPEYGLRMNPDPLQGTRIDVELPAWKTYPRKERP